MQPSHFSLCGRQVWQAVVLPQSEDDKQAGSDAIATPSSAVHTGGNQLGCETPETPPNRAGSPPSDSEPESGVAARPHRRKNVPLYRTAPKLVALEDGLRDHL